MKKTLLLGFLLCFLSLIGGAAAIILAEFGAPVWVFVVLLGWLLTVGLPSLCAVLLLAHFWEGLPFLGFLVSAAVLALIFQCTAVWLFRRGIGRLRTGKST